MKGQWHKVTADDSMYSIAQRYGIRLRNLYKLNYKDEDYQPLPGDLLRVR
jgi:LysM repeat protein